MSNLENCDEIVGREWLESRHAAVRRMDDDPPDYVADNEFAVEVRRLNLGVRIKGTTRGEEDCRIPLYESIERTLARIGKPANGRTWVIDCDYDFPKGLPTTKVVRAQILRALQPLTTPCNDADLKRLRLDHPIDCRHRQEMDLLSHLHLPLKCGICLDLEEVAADRRARFVLGNVSDGHGILVLSELEKSIIDAINAKNERIAHRVNRFPEWWLLLVDHIGLVANSGLTEHEMDLLRARVHVEHPWSRVIIVSRWQPSSWYELQRNEEAPSFGSRRGGAVTGLGARARVGGP